MLTIVFRRWRQCCACTAITQYVGSNPRTLVTDCIYYNIWGRFFGQPLWQAQNKHCAEFAAGICFLYDRICAGRSSGDLRVLHGGDGDTWFAARTSYRSSRRAKGLFSREADSVVVCLCPPTDRSSATAHLQFPWPHFCKSAAPMPDPCDPPQPWKRPAYCFCVKKNFKNWNSFNLRKILLNLIYIIYYVPCIQ